VKDFKAAFKRNGEVMLDESYSRIRALAKIGCCTLQLKCIKHVELDYSTD
jgi:hypothetical protein